MLSRPWLRLSPRVVSALRAQEPVVALESTIISHGMPYPANVETAVEVERIVEAGGAVPATVAILDGVVHVGLSLEELQAFGELGPEATVKTSRRDLPVVVGLRQNGSTTVSATMLAAAAAGVDVFVTGGVGGVHRGAESTMDVSADLTELGKTPVAVVCAGVKSILDIPKTLEVLETQGVTVLGLGCDSFPAFFSASSPYPCPNRVDSVEDAARVFTAIRDLGLQQGMLLAVPNPSEAEGAGIEAAIETAVGEARARGIAGKVETPFLLARVNELTGGASLAANVGLIKNNARVGAALAVHRAAMARESGGRRPMSFEPQTRRHMSSAAAGRQYLFAVGGVVVDSMCRLSEDLVMETSNPGVVTQQFGGVARNVAATWAALGVSFPLLLSAVGGDGSEEAVSAHLSQAGIVAVGGWPSVDRTASYVALLDKGGDLVAAVADMDAFAAITPAVVAFHDVNIARAACVVADANLPADALQELGLRCAAHGTPLVFEPTSVAKSRRAVEAGMLANVTIVTPNVDEVVAMGDAYRAAVGLPRLASLFESGGGSEDEANSRHSASVVLDSDASDDSEGGVELNSIHLAAAQTVLAAMCEPAPSPVLVDGRKHVVLTLGEAGVMVLSSPPASDRTELDMMLDMSFFQAVYATDMEFGLVEAPEATLVNCTGAGDTLVGGLTWGLWQGWDMRRCVAAGLAAAKHSVESESAVSGELTEASVVAAMQPLLEG